MLLKNLIWTEGRNILLISLALALGAYFIHSSLFVLAVLFIGFCFYFFRNPERMCPAALENKNIIISPADGKIIAIQTLSNNNGFSKKVSIFLSPLDVHVNWIPSSGVIEQVTYSSGEFRMAFTDKSSELNERNDIIIRTECGVITVRQIAGTIARKIVCWVSKGDSVKAGDKYGMIKFGSRIDLLLPDTVDISVVVGQRVYGGSSVLGRWLC